MPRVVVLGCGTAVGKTRVSVALLRALTQQGIPNLGLKPIESGIAGATTDADALGSAGSVHPKGPHPLYAFRDAVSPHLAARIEGRQIDIRRVSQWVSETERDMALLIPSHMAISWSVVETAGGVFSPLGADASNFDLAKALDPAIWILVAADALGVLHDVSATLQAMRASGRAPDHLVLCGARAPDASTGSNATELETLGIATPSAVLARDDDSGITQLVDRLLASG